LELVDAKDCTEVVEVVAAELESGMTVNLWAGRLNGKMKNAAKRLSQDFLGSMDAGIIGVNKTLGRMRESHKPNRPPYGKLIHKDVKNRAG